MLAGAFSAVGVAALEACGVAGPGNDALLGFCPAAAAPDPRAALIEAERLREPALRDRLDRLHVRLAEAHVACIAPGETTETLPTPEPSLPAPEPTPRPEPPQPQTREFDRRVAREGGRRGDVQVTLIWDNFNDLDLWVICPNGRRIYYASMQGCNGELDVDANGGGPRTRSPVENVTWPRGAPPGRYRVEINHFSNHGDRDPTPYRIRIRVGDREQIHEGSLHNGQPNRVLEFTVP